MRRFTKKRSSGAEETTVASMLMGTAKGVKKNVAKVTKKVREIFSFGSARRASSSAGEDSSFMKPVRKPTTGNALACRRCKVKAKEGVIWGEWVSRTGKDGTMTHAPVGEQCGRCYSTFKQGDYETTHGSFHDLCDDLELDMTGDKDREFEQSCQIREGEVAKTFPPSSMDLGRSQKFRARVFLRGLKPSEFSQRFHGKSPAQCGYSLQDLVHPDQSLYKGVLLKDDGRFGCLGVSYSYESELAVILKEEHMGPQRQVRAQQGMDLFNYFTSPSAEEDQHLKRFRLTTLTPSDVEEAIEKLGKLGGSETERALGSDESVEAAGNQEVAAVESKSSAFAGFSLRQSDLHTPNEKRKTADASSLGLPSGSPHSVHGGGSNCQDASDVDEDADVDPITARVLSIRLFTILGGNRMGHKRRRLREKVQHLSKNDDDASKSEAARYLDRLGLADVADDLSNSTTVRMLALPELEAKIDKISPQVSQWPSPVQISLLHRYCSEHSDALVDETANVGRILPLICLWEVSLAADTELEEFVQLAVGLTFHPKAPTLRACDGSFQEKCLSFKELFVSEIILPIIRLTNNANRSKAADVVGILDKTLVSAPVVEFNGDEASHPAAVYVLTVVARCLLHLLVPSSSKHQADFNLVIAASPESHDKANSVWLVVASAIRATDFWQNEVWECRKKGATHAESMAAANEVREILETIPKDGSTAEDWSKVLPHVQGLRKLIANTRPGALADLVQRVMSVVDDCAKQILNTTLKLSDLSAAQAQEVLVLFTSGSELLDGVRNLNLTEAQRLTWTRASQRIAEYKPLLASQVSESAFEPWIKSLEPFAFLSEPTRAEIIDKINLYRKNHDPDVRVDTSVISCLDSLLKSFSEQLASVPLSTFGRTFDECSIVHCLLSDLLTEWHDVGADAIWKTVRQTMQACVSCSETLSAVHSLGKHTDDMVGHCDFQVTLVRLAGYANSLDTLLATVGKAVALPCAADVRNSAVHMIRHVGPLLVKKLRGRIDQMFNGKYDEDDETACSVRLALGGCTDGSVWSSKLDAGASYKAVMSVVKITLYQNKNSALKKRLDMIAAAVQEAEAIEKTVVGKPDGLWRTQIEDELHRGYASVFEGLVMYHINKMETPAKLKTAIVKEESIAKKNGGLIKAHDSIKGFIVKVKAMESCTEG